MTFQSLCSNFGLKTLAIRLENRMQARRLNLNPYLRKNMPRAGSMLFADEIGS